LHFGFKKKKMFWLLLIQSLVLCSNAKTPVYNHTVVNIYPHDPTAFTEGLIFNDQSLFESTGLRGLSTLRRVDLETGKMQEEKCLNATYFGEGITEMNGYIYQLTWTSGKIFKWDKDTFELVTM
jgi:glutaminyl-peptide cyclotransferase